MLLKYKYSTTGSKLKICEAMARPVQWTEFCGDITRIEQMTGMCISTLLYSRENLERRNAKPAGTTALRYDRDIAKPT